MFDLNSTGLRAWYPAIMAVAVCLHCGCSNPGAPSLQNGPPLIPSPVQATDESTSSDPVNSDVVDSGCSGDSKGARLVSRRDKTEREQWAILIGATDYQDMSRLRYCGRDMRALRDVLVKQGGYNDANIRLLVDGNQPGEAEIDAPPTRKNILHEFDCILKDVGPKDSVLFAFSGHGIEQGGRGYLMPVDGQRSDLQETAVPISTVNSKLEECGAGSLFIIVDACHSGGTKGAAFDQRKYFSGDGLFGLYSCKADQESFEDESLRHGVFTYHLVEGLKGRADRPEKNGVPDQQISLFEACLYVTEQVPKHKRARDNEPLGNRQNPFFVIKGSTTPVLTIAAAEVLDANIDFLTLPGLNGGWWAQEAPWLLPVFRPHLASAFSTSVVAAKPLSDGTIPPPGSGLYDPNTQAVYADLRKAFTTYSAVQQNSAARTSLDLLANWNINELNEESRRTILEQLGSLGDPHSVAAVQHHLDMSEAGDSYKLAIKKYEENGREPRGLYARCIADYGRWLATSRQSAEAVTKFQYAAREVPAIEAAPLFHIECLCGEAGAYRKLGLWEEARDRLLRAEVIADEYLHAAHPMAASIQQSQAWLYMDRWHLRDAESAFLKAIEIRNENQQQSGEADYHAQVASFHNEHGLAMAARYAGHPGEAIDRYRELQKRVRRERDNATDPMAKSAYTGRLVNTIERLGDSYLMSPQPLSEEAAAAFGHALRESRTLTVADQKTTRARLICKRAVALAFSGRDHDARIELANLEFIRLLPQQEEALLLYRDIAEAVTALTEEASSPEKIQALRRILGEAVEGERRSRYSRDEFDLLLTSGCWLIRTVGADQQFGAPLIFDVRRLFELLPDAFAREEVFAYQRRFYDNGLTALLERPDSASVVAALEHFPFAKRRSRDLTSVGDFGAALHFYWPAEDAAGGFLVIRSETGSQLVRLSHTLRDLRAAIESGETIALGASAEAALREHSDPYVVCWRDEVWGLSDDRFPYSLSGDHVFSTDVNP